MINHPIYSNNSNLSNSTIKKYLHLCILLDPMAASTPDAEMGIVAVFLGSDAAFGIFYDFPI